MNAYTTDERRTLAARASTPFERLTPAFRPAEVQDEAKIAARLERWTQFAAKGDPARLDRRLALDGLDRDAARRMVGDVTLAEDAPLPTWVETLDAAMQIAAGLTLDALRDPHFTPRNRFLFPDEPAPFEELAAPFVLAASEKLDARVPEPVRARLRGVARAQLEHSLLRSLCDAAGQVLLGSFSALRAPHVSRLQSLAPGEASRALYDEFVRDMLAGGKLRTLYFEFAALARLNATLADLWVEMAAEFLTRLDADWEAIETAFGEGKPLGLVTALKASVSDRHHGARGVVLLRFESGARAVYKPKDLGIDAAFENLVRWANNTGIGTPLRALRVLYRPGYGWVEFVANAPLDDEEAARRYYRRAGALACLVYIVGGADFHRENLIAAGEYPYLIDLELVLYPHVRPFEGIEGEISLHAADWMFTDSVVGSGLLSAWGLLPGGRSVDIAGFGADTLREVSFRAPKWHNVNRDTMTYQTGTHVMESRENVPFIRRGETPEAVPPYRYREALEAGFREMYRRALVERDRLTGPHSPLLSMAGSTARFIVRETQLYRSVYTRSLRPDVARDGADRGIAIEQLSRALMLSKALHPLWDALHDELDALTIGDVPLFNFKPGENALILAGDRRIEGPFAETGHILALKRIAAMSEEDMDRQLALMRGALAVRFAGQGGATLQPFDKPLAEIEPPSDETLVSAALDIADKIEAQAIRFGGAAEWIQPEYVPNANRFELLPMSYTLYEGKTGVALFLAAVARVTGDSRWSDLALAAVHNLRIDLRHADTPFMRRIGIGGMGGYGGIAYALAQMAKLLDMPALLDDARRAADQITAEAVAADAHLDLMSGVSGALMGLLTTHQATGDAAYLDMARRCGDRLLETQIDVPRGRAWITLEKTVLIGYLHGSAGIGAALGRLFGATGDPRYLDAARAALRYEWSRFDATAQNYPDLRPSNQNPDGKPAFTHNYCHGAPGIGLARLALLPHLGDEEAARALTDIEAAAQVASAPEILQRFDLACCGNFGRIEILNGMGRVLGIPGWNEDARQRAAWALARAKNRGYFFLTTDLPPNIETLSLMQGLSGIGYGLLRLAFPDLLPPLLRLE